MAGFATYSILFYDWERKEGDPEPFEAVSASTIVGEA
jgi:hypothetical protein